MTHSSVLRKEGTALVVIDFQEKLVPFVSKRDETLKNAATMLQAARIYNIPIVLTEHYPKGLGRTVPEISAHIPGIQPIEKVVFSAFGAPEFVKRLEELRIRTLIVEGIETHICINQTVHDALEMGYGVHVISDAVSSRAEHNYHVGIEKMRQSGAVISSTEMALYELQHRADVPEFKDLLKLIK